MVIMINIWFIWKLYSLVRQKDSGVQTRWSRQSDPWSPFLACWARMRRLRAVVPFGMLMIYFPSISEVTRRRFTGSPFASAEDSLATIREWEGKKERQKIKVWKMTRCGHWADVCAWGTHVHWEINIYSKITPSDMVTAKGMRWAAIEERAIPILELLLEIVTERRLSGRREGVLGGESRLKALAIMRVAAEMEKIVLNYNIGQLCWCQSSQSIHL